jgi:hypothetical protein
MRNAPNVYGKRYQDGWHGPCLEVGTQELRSQWGVSVSSVAKVSSISLHADALCKNFGRLTTDALRDRKGGAGNLALLSAVLRLVACSCGSRLGRNHHLHEQGPFLARLRSCAALKSARNGTGIAMTNLYRSPHMNQSAAILES